MKKWYQIVFVMVALLAVIAFGIVSHPSVAHAGSTGQQILFTINNNACPQGTLQGVQISGTNQDGVSTPWSGSSTDGGSVFTQNYWWTGNVSITYQVNGTSYTVNGFIPQRADQNQPDPDTSYVSCMGTRQWATAIIVTGDGYNSGCIVLDSNPLGHYTITTYYSGYEYVGKDAMIVSSNIVGSKTMGIVEVIGQTDVPSCDS